ncbi:type II secretion system F family protein [Arthrobacter sp. MSA 4-2]|uniref:type II secretion system F family protein n=1 Tax=Arthrobacter sp. MSA 4-2 TaxID=2794349 RepID=UPI0018E8D248|nr:type II secretion system F family protein [Arthrobacter sp. MSA 4-2]MBJ2120503.1 type II secretion system F family protein [Arthrobacter sp. MSA 4-2]
MTPIAWIYISTVILPVTYLTWALLTNNRRAVAAIRTNLGTGLENSTSELVLRKPALTEIARRLTPRGYVIRLDRWLALAGRPASLPLDRLLVAKPALGLIGATLGFLFFSKNPSTMIIFFAIFLCLFFYFVPDLFVFNSGTKRQQEIELELPNTLDQMLISVEAGLGFEAAMARAGQNGKGPLAEEIVRTLQDIQVGRPRVEAYKALADRSSVPDLRSFVRAVVQADRYGIGIATVLRTQAKQSRVKRRQRAEEKAMQLPVKVLFPLLLLIFPVLFIVILGPAAINVMESFS